MTDDSQPAQCRFESMPALMSCWCAVHLQRTGTTGRCTTCDSDNGLVLLRKGGDSPAVQWHELVPLCKRCAEHVTAILATRCPRRSMGRYAPGSRGGIGSPARPAPRRSSLTGQN